jgi:hypothetical protein
MTMPIGSNVASIENTRLADVSHPTEEVAGQTANCESALPALARGRGHELWKSRRRATFLAPSRRSTDVN